MQEVPARGHGEGWGLWAGEGWGEAPSCACGEVIFILGKEFPVWPFGGSTYTPVTPPRQCRAMKPLEVSSGAFTLGVLGTLHLPWEGILVPVSH